MRENKNVATKLAHWREKAKCRGKMIHYQNRKILDLEQSRSTWKKKYYEEKAARHRLEKSLGSKPKENKTLVSNHSYSAELIELCIGIRSAGGCSYRGCVKILQTLLLLLNLEFDIPSFSSIRNWEMKLGYYELAQSSDASEQWALIIDESISIGSQKLLLLLGVNLNQYTFNQALGLSDVRVLDIRLKKSWKAPDISGVISDVIARNYQLKYCCCDNGNNLCNSLYISGLEHIEDCGHALGNWLEKTYADNQQFIDFCNASTMMKKQLILSEYAEYIPPKQRTKGRFLNISGIVKWANKLLSLAQQYEKSGAEPKAFEKIKWIISYQEFIKKLTAEQQLINQVNKVLKNNGLSNGTVLECTQYIESSEVESSLKEFMLDYLKRTRAKLPGMETIICSSDIIESIFGLFKYNHQKSPCGAITESCLSIASYGKKTETEGIKNAMEQVTIVDLKRWRADNLSITIQQKRKKLFKNTS